MRNTTTIKGLAELLQVVDVLERLHETLGDVIDAKLSAMKRADVHAMRDFGEQEQALAARIREREGLRRQIMDRIGDALGFVGGRARTLSAVQLADHLLDPQRRELLDATESLGRSVRRVAQINRVAGVTTREMLHHLRWVVSSVRPQRAATSGYAGDGTLVSPSDTIIFDAVG